MDKKKLIDAGLTEEQAANVVKLHKEVIDGQFVPKHRFDEINTELKTAKEQLTERDGQIKELKKFKGDSEALAAKITELEEANKQKATEYQTSLATERKRNAIRLALLEDAEGKPFDADMVMGLFDLEKVIMDETTGKISAGFKEQNEAIRKEKGFLFEPKADPANPNGWKPRGNGIKDGDPGTPPNTSEAYGKSLASIKLGMMGIAPGSTNE